MARTIWVKAANPRAVFYQEVFDDNGKLHGELVRAETIDGEQVPVPVEVTVSPDVTQALAQRVPLNPQQAAILEECSDDEVSSAKVKLSLSTGGTAPTPAPAPTSKAGSATP